MYACRGAPCNYTRDDACLITSRRPSYKNSPSAHLRLSDRRTLFRLIMRFVWTQRSQNDIVRWPGVNSPTFPAIRTVNHTACADHASSCARRRRPTSNGDSRTQTDNYTRCSGVLMFNGTELCAYVLLVGCFTAETTYTHASQLRQQDAYRPTSWGPAQNIDRSLTICLTRMCADAHDGRPAEYRWRPLRRFRNSIPCTTPQSLADAHYSSAVH